MKLWLAGSNERFPCWELLGIYSSELAAVSRCKTERDFVAPYTLDVDAPDETVELPGCYFPLATSP
jgi:hypothetical protein